MPRLNISNRRLCIEGLPVVEDHALSQIKAKLCAVLTQFPAFRQHRLVFSIHIFHQTLIEELLSGAVIRNHIEGRKGRCFANRGDVQDLFARFRSACIISGVTAGVSATAGKQAYTHNGGKSKSQNSFGLFHLISFLSLILYLSNGFFSDFTVFDLINDLAEPRGNSKVMSNDQVGAVMFLRIFFQKLKDRFC